MVFIASRGDYFPMLHQQGGASPNHLVLWDYHVILCLNGQILDFNSTLHFCSPLPTYFEHSFIDESLLDPLEIPLFRVLPADEYVRTFRSDRSHMKTETGWQAPPPDWPLICESGSNLQRFTNMTDLEFGEVLSADEVLSTAFSK